MGSGFFCDEATSILVQISNNYSDSVHLTMRTMYSTSTDSQAVEAKNNKKNNNKKKLTGNNKNKTLPEV